MAFDFILLYDVTFVTSSHGQNTFLRVNRNFVKCYSNKKRIKELELPLQAQHNDVSSVFVAFMEIKLWLFKILDIYAWVHALYINYWKKYIYINYDTVINNN